MYRKQDNCIEFKNHNINIKFDPETIEKATRDFYGVLSEVLFWLDCYFVGDVISLGNWDAGYNIYNTHSNRFYTISGGDIENLKAGKSIKLFARVPDNYDNEILQDFFGEV